MTHPNSNDGYRALRDSGALEGKRQTVYAALQRLGRATDRQVKEWLGAGDMNAVRPRITELIEAGWAEEVGTCTDATTQRTVRVVRALTADERRERDEVQTALDLV